LVNRRFYRKNCLNFVDFSKNMLIIVFRMDAQINNRNAVTASFAALGSANHVVGAKQIRKALTAGSARQVFLAKNADPAITEPLAALCQLNRVEYAWVRPMADLGRACGIEVGAAAAAIVA
jgi:large subunit ribosomal protein L7A